ncbi:MAG: uroporphyrinogen decarboxylase family protein [Bacillota bacterium]|nr:uroporphyrinogen decarboxylase family protein [Bacillota bacterium]MDW7684857.1 uroporphyrinogen decarboxylase family protein [Bacillota bacterium]
MHTNGMIRSRERVKNVIEGGLPDRIPKGELCINDDVICSGSADCKLPAFEQRYAFIKDLGLDLVSLSPLYPMGLNRLPQQGEYQWPDLQRWVEETPLFTFAVLDGAFEWGMRIFGLEKFFIMLRKQHPALAEFISQVEELNLSMAAKLQAEGIDGFILADDIAYQGGLLAGPDIMRQFFIPSLNRQVDKIVPDGLPVFYHSDGDYRAVLEEIIHSGISGLQCLEKEAGMNLAELRRRVGDGICLWGHLDVEDIELAADPACRQALIQSIRAAASQGKFILGTTSGIFSGTDVGLLQSIYKAM